MKRLTKTTLVSIPLTILLCFTYGSPSRLGPSSEEAKKQRAVQKIVEHIEQENSSNLDDEGLAKLANVLYDESKRHRIDYRLVLAVMKVESNFKHDAVSHRGARGLLQLRPIFAKYLAKDAGLKWDGEKTLDEPRANIMLGVRHLSNLIGDFESIHLALQAYHVGPTRLREMLSVKSRPNMRFLNLVLKQYKKNISELPEP